MVTSIAAERSAALAGKHLNALIPFPVEKCCSAESLSKKALSNLQRSPIKSRVLQHLDVIFVEELSMISSELWAATDHVLQVVTANYVPFGGKLVVATGDFFQLPPPSGSYLMSSSFPLTTFAFHNLKISSECGTRTARNCYHCYQQRLKQMPMQKEFGKLWKKIAILYNRGTTCRTTEFEFLLLDKRNEKQPRIKSMKLNAAEHNSLKVRPSTKCAFRAPTTGVRRLQQRRSS